MYNEDNIKGGTSIRRECQTEGKCIVLSADCQKYNVSGKHMQYISTLGLYMAFENTIDNVDVKVKALEDTDLEYSVYLSDEKDEEGNCLKIFSSSIRMHKTEDFTWMNLPINLYLGDNKCHIKLTKNPQLAIADETYEKLSEAAH